MVGHPPAPADPVGSVERGTALLILHFATANPGKVREIQRLLGAGFEVRPPPPGFRAPPEEGRTYRENALAKARALHRMTGSTAVGDDSGLEVDALGGRPGIHSARYGACDAARIDRLLVELRGIPVSRRGARFRCVLGVVLPDRRELCVEGTCAGVIAEAPAGTGGFGYDPIFVVPETGRTFAEMAPEEKDRLSHRGHAVRQLAALLSRPDP